GAGVADPDADAGGAAVAARRARASGQAVARPGAVLRLAASDLRPRPRGGAAASFHYAHGDAGHGGGDGLAVHHHSERILPGTGYRPDPWRDRGGAEYLAGRNDRAAGAGDQRGDERS